MGRLVLTSLGSAVVFGIAMLVGVVWFHTQPTIAIVLTLMATCSTYVAGAFVYGIGDLGKMGPEDNAEIIE